MSEKKLKFETIQLHGGQSVESDQKSRAVPIYQTTSYLFDDPEHAADLFGLKKLGNIYTRLTNPTNGVFEERISQLEGGVAGLAVASGMAAITYAVFNVAKAGENIVSASTLYGGTYTLFSHTLKNFGIDVKFVNPDDVGEFRKAIDDKTKAIFIETIGNPEGNIADISAIADIAHENKIPLIVDNTFATPYLCRPIEHGADIVVHSATKFIGGHGTSIGGVIVDGGTFDWTSGKFPAFTEPDASYHGLRFAEAFGEAAFAFRIRTVFLRDTGACLSPMNGFLLLQGVETLSLRMERHVENAERVAEYLEDHPKIEWVKYPGLKSSKYYGLKEKYLPNGASAIFTFGVKGGYEAGKKLIESVELFSHLANIGDAKSLIIHPASTTHQQLTEEEQKSAGVRPETVRISVGIENVDDIIADLEQALSNI